jgi:putative hydroxymethylpyrimidine transport system substrate-binding protein
VRRITIGFESVQALVAGRVDAAPVFWNAEGVALRERGVDVKEFRVEDYGAPEYPEVVFITSRKTLDRRRDQVRDTLLAIRDGVAAVEKDPAAAVDQVASEARSSGKDLIGAQLDAVRPIFSRDLTLDRRVLDAWAAFDAKIGIVEEKPDVAGAFAFDVLAGNDP